MGKRGAYPTGIRVLLAADSNFEFVEFDREALFLAVTQIDDGHDVARLSQTDLLDQSLKVWDGDTVKLKDHVFRLKSGGITRSVGDETTDDQSVLNQPA